MFFADALCIVFDGVKAQEQNNANKNPSLYGSLILTAEFFSLLTLARFVV
jgi:hypothetical protein